MAENLVNLTFAPPRSNDAWPVRHHDAATSEGWLYLVCIKDVTWELMGYAMDERVEQNVLFETATAVSATAGPAAGQLARSVMQTLLNALHSDQDADWAHARQSLLEVQDQTWLQST